ncbi:MAG: HDOD domain-containing protein [Planctomycetota bacterium]
MQAVSHAINLRGVLTSRKLQGIASRMASIPSLPELYQDLHESLQEPNVSMDQVAAVISQDPGMTAKILKLVNSAFFGLRRTVADGVPPWQPNCRIRVQGSRLAMTCWRRSSL